MPASAMYKGVPMQPACEVLTVPRPPQALDADGAWQASTPPSPALSSATQPSSMLPAGLVPRQ